MVEDSNLFADIRADVVRLSPATSHLCIMQNAMPTGFPGHTTGRLPLPRAETYHNGSRGRERGRTCEWTQSRPLGEVGRFDKRPRELNGDHKLQRKLGRDFGLVQDVSQASAGTWANPLREERWDELASDVAPFINWSTYSSWCPSGLVAENRLSAKQPAPDVACLLLQG